MSFVKYVGTATEYQGESFTKSLYKEDKTAWENNDTCTFSLVNSAGIEVSVGDLILSGDKLSMTVQVPKTDTLALVGEHLLLVSLGNVSDSEFADVIAEYRITYLEKKAGE